MKFYFLSVLLIVSCSREVFQNYLINKNSPSYNVKIPESKMFENITEKEEDANGKEKWRGGSVRLRWVCLGVLATCAALAAAAWCDRDLPVPLDGHAHPERFHGLVAHEHVVNLTALGARVAGSYENEVAAVRVLVEAARALQAAASPHNRVDFDVFAASGAFSLSFIDGMSNVYRDVQSVALRVRGAGSRGPTAALLLNCHFDTVPDSPGASDDAAGCGVVLETVRALAASPRPLRHDLVALLNGAEENIMQASHAFVTSHRWAKSLRAFINIEACGAGGREVLFQAGPRDPWMLEVYAGAVPHPFASSLAQELFQSGLIPADTDFRIFRDYGNLSGVDLAWHTDGYVYHTPLDTAQRVPPAALQRTGDNVLALARALLDSERLDEAAEASRQPVFFDVLGRFVVIARAPAAALAALFAVVVVALKVYLSARAAQQRLYVRKRAWAWVVGRALVSVVLAQCCGLAAAVATALVLHAAGARLSWYARVWQAVPLFAVPALCGSWWDARLTWGKARRGGLPAVLRGEWTVRVWTDALSVAAAALGAAGAALGLRSAFVPFLWTLPAAAEALCAALGGAGGARAACWAAGAALPVLQTGYLALGSVNMFVPVMGRAGTSPLPPDVIIAVVVGGLTLAMFNWMLPLVVGARCVRPLLLGGWAVALGTAALVAGGPLAAPYTAARPQRYMVFHTARTDHSAQPPATDHLYWLPELDANTPSSLRAHLPEVARASPTSPPDCERWLYCGAPYFLPVLSLVSRGHSLPAPEPPLVRLQARAELAAGAGERERELRLHLAGPSHVVVVVAAPAGGEVAWCSASEGLAVRPQPGPQWRGRPTYFVSLHDARSPQPWTLRCAVRAGAGRVPGAGEWAAVSAAGHAMSGEARRSAAHAALLARFPNWTAVTGWGVDLHLFSL